MMTTTCSIPRSKHHYSGLIETLTESVELESLSNWQRMDALGKLTGQVAHDFNNLLMVFQSGVEIIKRRQIDDPRVSRIVVNMSEGVARGKLLTRRLLSFASRSNQGAEQIVLQTKLSSSESIMRQALNDTITLEMKVAEDVWAVHADPAAFEIALINLLTNAREAMEDGGKVTISAQNVTDAAEEDGKLYGPFVAIAVADTGKGISASHLGRLFEPFFSTKGDKRPGLGLTQVYSFSKSSGGAAKVTSVLGHGTAFSIFLPKPHETIPSGIVCPGSEDLPKTVLVVDDTPASLAAAKATVETLGLPFITAKSGTEALGCGLIS